MVEVTEEPPSTSPPGGDEADARSSASDDGASQSQTQTGGGMNAVIEHMTRDKVEAAMWASRIGSIIFTISFVLPIFGSSQHTSGQRVLICGAITSALKLHKRIPRFSMNREFLFSLVQEDSAHYLLYSVIILWTAYPVSMVLMPVFLFALLHVTSYTRTLLNVLGEQSIPFIRKMLTKVDSNQRTMLRLIATVEIFLMPTTVILVFSGQAALFLPFMYYRFLCMRYTSQRNPYSRMIFTELKMTVQYMMSHAKCPAIGRTILQKMIDFTLRLCPAQAPPQPAQ